MAPILRRGDVRDTSNLGSALGEPWQPLLSYGAVKCGQKLTISEEETP